MDTLQFVCGERDKWRDRAEKAERELLVERRDGDDQRVYVHEAQTRIVKLERVLEAAVRFREQTTIYRCNLTGGYTTGDVAVQFKAAEDALRNAIAAAIRRREG